MTVSMRPGIYAECIAYPLHPLKPSRTVGLIAAAETVGASEKLLAETIKSVAEAENKFGINSNMTQMIKAVRANSDCGILAVCVKQNDIAQYQEAIRLLFSRKEAYCIAADLSDSRLALSAREAAAETSADSRKLFFGGCPADTAPEQFALSLNCERIILSYPPLPSGKNAFDLSPALLAALAADLQAGDNLFGVGVKGSDLISSPLTEEKINQLLKSGVTVLENGADGVEVVRCVTSRTHNAEGAPDSSLRNLGQITALDEAVALLSSALHSRFQSAKGGLTTDAVRSLVECELIEMQEAGLIKDYASPQISLDSQDRSICQIGVSITLRQSVTQIYLSVYAAI